MNNRTDSRDWAEEVPHNLGERIARFAMAINGLSAQNVSKSYWEQAKGELASKSATDSNEAVLESAPEPEYWHAVPSSAGPKAPVARQGFQAG